MLAHLLVVVAARGESGGAAPSSTSTSPGCPALEVRGTVPADGAVVPTDVVFRAIVDPAYEACYTPIVELFGAAGVPIAASVASRGNGLWALTPEEPLAAGGTYTFRVSDPVYAGLGDEITVTVGEPLPPATDPPELVLEVRDHCPSLEVLATVRLEADASMSGLLTIAYDLDGQPFEVLFPVSDQAVFEHVLSVWAAGVVCAGASLTDLADRPVWSVGPTCAPDVSCPTYDPPDAVTFSMEAVCDADLPSTRIVADLELPAADATAAGVLAMAVTTSLGSQGFPWAVSLEGPVVDQHVDVTVLGNHDVCFEIVGFDPMGEEIWRDEPRCSDEPLSCPAEARDPDEVEGCGCADAPGGGWWALPGVVGLLARRRRSG